MRIIYMGTPEFAVEPLESLYEHHDVSLVVTRPDKVRGRGKTLCPTPVKCAAEKLGIEVVEATRIDDDIYQKLCEHAPDVIVVAAFGCILPKRVLTLPRLEIINIHASLLPRWRGAAPIQRAILSGDTHTGVSIMRVSEGLDEGAYMAQASLEIGNLSCEALTQALSHLGAKELICALEKIEQGHAQWIEQDTAKVTYAKKIGKQELLIAKEDDARTVVQKVQASSDVAPCRVVLAGKTVRMLNVSQVDATKFDISGMTQGTLRMFKHAIIMATRAGFIQILRLKPEGKKAMDASAWGNGLSQAQAIAPHTYVWQPVNDGV